MKSPAAKDTGKELYNASLSATEVASSLSSSLKQHQQQKEAEQLMEIEKLRQKLESTERAMAKLVAEMNTDQYEAKVSIATGYRYRYRYRYNDSDTFISKITVVTFSWPARAFRYHLLIFILFFVFSFSR